MRNFYFCLGLVGLAGIIIGLAWAEQFTMSTYYPAPYGVYRNFSTTSKTCLATNQLGSDSNAEVGIGIEAPLAKVHIHEAGPTDANSGQLMISETATNNSMLLGRTTNYGFIQSHNAEPLALNPLGNKVGIGTDQPDWPLDVNGNIQMQGPDLLFDVPGRTSGTPNRAVVAGVNDSLIINYDNDFSGGVIINGLKPFTLSAPLENAHPVPNDEIGKLKMGYFNMPQVETPISNPTDHLKQFTVYGFRWAGARSDHWVWGVDTIRNKFCIIHKIAGARPRLYFFIVPDTGQVVEW